MKILVLGSDFGTIDLVNQAHKSGDYVVVADYYEHTSTKRVADEAVNISTLDIDTVTDYCRSNKIEAITFGANDVNISAGRKIAKRLGLPYYCENDYAYDLSCNKRMFKELCKKIGAPIATDYVISATPSDEELENIAFPVVVKAVDLAANVGFSYCNNKHELIEAIAKVKSLSNNSNFIVERCLHGPEFVANYVLADGKAVLNHFCSEHHQPGELANLYSLINTSSYQLKHYLGELDAYVVELFKEAGFTEGVAWVECMLDDDGHFYLLEPGYRFCGEVTYVPYGVLSGFNPIEWMLDIAKGKKHTIEELPEPLTTGRYGSAMAYHLFGCKAGTVERIDGLDEIAKIPDVVIDLPHREGYDMRYHKNMGVIRFPAYTKEEMIKYLDVINNNLKVLDANGDNLIIYFTNYDEVIGQYEQGLIDYNM